MAHVKVTGLDRLMSALDAAGDNAPRFARKALEEEAQEAFYLSQQVVPVMTGALRSSGVVHPSELIGNVAKVQITYGGPATPYAIYVHEMPPSRVRHDYPTQWKFLENPVRLYAKGMAERMTTRVLDMINRGF